MNITGFRGYEILAILPKGGMSTVYKARQLSLDRVVAIKALPSTTGIDPAEVEKFMIEARITAGLKHPNIVQVYDFGKTEDGIYYFVMEYISGYSVADWIRRKQYLPEEDSLLCALIVAGAMNYAWEKAGIVHCDIKPDNVIIDGDGTVKVADLGLARSVKLIMGPAGADDGLIFGTPNYISPEQSRGDVPLDCRADIYSLGAMLYHCMTGTMPFEGIPPLEVMDLQISDQIPDPQDANPGISGWSAGLIEKMMAKDRNFRPQDWNETIRDITDVRSKKTPRGLLPPNVASTIKRSGMRELRFQGVSHLAAGEHPEPAVKKDDGLAFKRRRPAGLLRKIILSVAGVALVAFGWAAIHFTRDLKMQAGLESGQNKKTPEVQQPEIIPPKSAPLPGNVRDNPERIASEKYEQAMAWFKANPASLGEAISQFREVVDETAGTKYADMARVEAGKLEGVLAGTRTIMAQLDKNAKALVDQKHFLEAAAVYDEYHGPFNNETAAERGHKAQALQTEYTNYFNQQQQIEKLAESQLIQVVGEIAMILAENDLNAALGRMKELATNMPSISAKPEFKDLTALLEKSVNGEQRILDSFRTQKNQAINISFLRGPQKLLIYDVQGDTIVADEVKTIERGKISSRKTFTARDLTLDEKMARLGANIRPEIALMRAMLALQDSDYQKAAAAAAGTGPFLSSALGEAINQRAKKANELRAAQAMEIILRTAGIYQKGVVPDPAACLASLRNNPRAFGRDSTGNRMIGQFQARFGSTEVAGRYHSVLKALTNVVVNAGNNTAQESTPPSKPEEQQASVRPTGEVIIAKMMEQNPGLREDQIVLQMDDAGRIVKVELRSTRLRDISPLENLTDLKQLICIGAPQHDWPGSASFAPLSDLAPLKKMNLRELDLNRTKVKDISVLSQMSLQNLNLAHTKVNDLQPLIGLPLQNLDISFTPVRDIHPLARIPLAYLNISGTKIDDFSPLRGAPIKMLFADSTKIKDLSALGSMQLKQLSIRNTAVSDIASLRGMQLEYLDLSGTRIRDITVLMGMRLRKLDISDTDVGDLAALKDMRLCELNLQNTRVKDINVLAQMPLEYLTIGAPGVKDIAPLANMPLKRLDLRNTGVADLTPIEDSSLEEIWLDDFRNQGDNKKTRMILKSLRKMPKLMNINGEPVWMWTK